MPEGKARSAQNPLKRGKRAQKYVVVPDQDTAECQALEAALIAELAPAGTLHSVLAGHVARAALRLARADRMRSSCAAVGAAITISASRCPRRR